MSGLVRQRGISTSPWLRWSTGSKISVFRIQRAFSSDTIEAKEPIGHRVQGLVFSLSRDGLRQWAAMSRADFQKKEVPNRNSR